MGAIYAERPCVVFPGLCVVAAVHRGLPDEHEREGIVRLRGQSLHEARSRFVVQPQMQQDKALPDSRSVTTGIDVQGFPKCSQRGAVLEFLCRCPEKPPACAMS